MSEIVEPITAPQRPHEPGRAEPVMARDLPPQHGGDADARREQAEKGYSSGVNIEPGSDDDGWVVPPPVRLADGTRLQFYKDGEGLAAAFEAIKRATKRILLEVYIWPSDETGRAFAEVLAEQARRGVKVYAIYDGFGSLLADRAMFRLMRDAGVKLVEFHPARPWESRFSWRPFNRDHRKLLIVDDDIAGLGGLNLGNRYAGTWVAKVAKVDVDKLWRDAAMGIVGPGARQFARAFYATWNYCLHRGPIGRTQHVSNLAIAPAAKGRRLGKASEAARQSGLGGDRDGGRVWRHSNTPGDAAHAVGLFDGQGPRRRGLDELLHPRSQIACLATSPTLSSPLRPFLYSLLRDANRSITMTMAYFAPDDEFIAGLIAAARRGVKVRLMFAERSDARPLVLAARSFYERLLEAGCEVYERQHVMLHQKSMTVDGKISLLGSTNLDYRSIEFNLELSAVVSSRDFARQLQALFDHDTRFARRIDAEHWRRRPLWDRTVQWAVSRMRYLL